MTSIDQLMAQSEGKTLEFKCDLSMPKFLLKSPVAFLKSADGLKLSSGNFADCQAELKAVAGGAGDD
jgi:hypothetical protein